ncbi:HNH endonuclease signature motif containing protein [Actinomadura macrotermitis]|uniref:HNH nuclease domain-containing protein n=1 Tax=Actinomadura macrotermitis TaxID=2585200 RepID=A0A7K0BP53_9ACTN|nr:HNH endonuclease signature motif containing protein [Actinomadura macrotermitis]MQY02632.1 hypothetical protein [Actinomadura macrotermitis]
MASLAEVKAFRGEEREWEDRSWFPPGPQLAVCLSGDKNRLADLSDAELCERMAAARRQASWAQAQELAAIAELAARRHAQDEHRDPDYRVLSARESLMEEVSVALAVTGNAAATLVHLAERLAHQLPETREALQAGRIDMAKARAISDATDHLPDQLCTRIEDTVLDGAEERTTGQLRGRIKRLVRRLAPAELAEQTRRTVKGRRLELWESGHGAAGLALVDIPADDAAAVHNKLTAVAHGLKQDGDARLIDQIRADLALQLLRGVPLPEAVHAPPVEAENPPSTPAVPDTPEGDGDSIAEMIGHAAQRRLEELRAHVEFHGRLADLPRLAARAVQDLHERLAPLRDTACDHGKPGYRPPAALRRQIEARHATCVFPTCNRRSEHCDIDHTTPYGAHGAQGTTCGCNLAPLCRRHHRTKQTTRTNETAGWRLFQPWPGVLIWITPAGTWHITLPSRQ